MTHRLLPFRNLNPQDRKTFAKTRWKSLFSKSSQCLKIVTGNELKPPAVYKGFKAVLKKTSKAEGDGVEFRWEYLPNGYRRNVPVEEQTAEVRQNLRRKPKDIVVHEKQLTKGKCAGPYPGDQRHQIPLTQLPCAIHPYKKRVLQGDINFHDSTVEIVEQCTASAEATYGNKVEMAYEKLNIAKLEPSSNKVNLFTNLQSLANVNKVQLETIPGNPKYSTPTKLANQLLKKSKTMLPAAAMGSAVGALVGGSGRRIAGAAAGAGVGAAAGWVYNHQQPKTYSELTGGKEGIEVEKKLIDLKEYTAYVRAKQPNGSQVPTNTMEQMLDRNRRRILRGESVDINAATFELLEIPFTFTDYKKLQKLNRVEWNNEIVAMLGERIPVRYWPSKYRERVR